MREPFEDEEPQIVTGADLARGTGRRADPRLVEPGGEARARPPLGEDRYEQLSPRLARAGEELAAARRATRGDAGRRRANSAATPTGSRATFTDLFLERVWKPFDEAGRPAERWPEVVEALERMRPLAAESLLAIFQLAMTEASTRPSAARSSARRATPDRAPRPRGRRR